jgi:hypothetical protein
VIRGNGSAIQDFFEEIFCFVAAISFKKVSKLKLCPEKFCEVGNRLERLPIGRNGPEGGNNEQGRVMKKRAAFL